MSLKTAENLFAKIVESDDPKLAALVAEWCPWFASQRYSSYTDGQDVRASLSAVGVDSTASAKLSHSHAVSLAVDAASNANVLAAADSFILSMQSGRAHLQNPLRSISIVRHLPKHRFKGDFNCMVCGIQKENEWVPLDTAEQYPDGGVGVDYEWLGNLMVVRWFDASEKLAPKSKDISAFERVLKAIAKAAQRDTGVKISNILKKEIGGTATQWRNVFETLGFAGVLKTPAQPGNLQAWTNFNHRQDGHARQDAPSPSCFWIRSMGFDRDVFSSLFPAVKLPTSLIGENAE